MKTSSIWTDLVSAHAIYEIRNICTRFALWRSTRAGNWWKITNSNRTTVHYGGPPQTVVINCNPQIHQTHEITGINQTERLAGQYK